MNAQRGRWQLVRKWDREGGREREREPDAKRRLTNRGK